jgi:hypothetical protein
MGGSGVVDNGAVKVNSPDCKFGLPVVAGPRAGVSMLLTK